MIDDALYRMGFWRGFVLGGLIGNVSAGVGIWFLVRLAKHFGW
jgi:hypothetical protein